MYLCRVPRCSRKAVTAFPPMTPKDGCAGTTGGPGERYCTTPKIRPLPPKRSWRSWRPAEIRHDGAVAQHAERPWGSYITLAECESFKVKTIVVHPAQRISYQTHARRAEHWFVVEGEGVVTLDGEQSEVR